MNGKSYVPVELYILNQAVGKIRSLVCGPLVLSNVFYKRSSAQLLKYGLSCISTKCPIYLMRLLHFGCWVLEGSIALFNIQQLFGIRVLGNFSEILCLHSWSALYTCRLIFHQGLQRILMHIFRALTLCNALFTGYLLLVMLAISTHTANSSNQTYITVLLSWVSLLQDLEIACKQKARVIESIYPFCFSQLIVLC